MGFEAQGSGGWDGTPVESPGGHVFGLQGWTWGPPVPKSITFFLDGSAMVCDQYGRQILRAVAEDGRELRFADSPPDATKEGTIVPRPQFASHAQVIEALSAENIDWLSYEVRYRDKANRPVVRGNLTLQKATDLQGKLFRDGCVAALVTRTIACAGWPQLPYAELKKLPEVPPTPERELLKIRDPKLRADALRLRREVDAVRQRELAPEEEPLDVSAVPPQ